MTKILRICVAAMLAVSLLVAQTARTADVELKAAQHKAEVEGDLQGAIRQYGAIAAKYAKSNRSVSAMALVHMADCYQKTGDTAARKIYEQVIREYADQKEAVEVAQSRLGNRATAARVLGDHAVWTGPKVDLFGRVSPDGRYISYVDWIDTGNLMVHDNVTGVDRSLTPNRSWADGSYAEFSSISKDGKRVAYGWFNAKNECELRAVPIDGAGASESRRLFSNAEEITDIAPYDWSADGRWIAVHLQMKDFSGRIALVSAVDGALRVLKSDDWHGPSKIFFSPDSRYIAYDLSVSDTTDNTDLFIMAVDGSHELAAAAHPAQDIVMGWSPDGKYLLFASDRTGKMSLWALPVVNGKPQGAPEMVKPDIGTPWSLGLTDAGALYVFKRVGGFDVQVASFDSEAARVSAPQPGLGVTKIDQRPANWSRDGKYLSDSSCGETGSGACKISIRSLMTGEVRQLRPRLQYLVDPAWSPDGRFFVTGGRGLKGHWGVFRVDAATGEVSLIAPADAAGTFPQWSPDGEKVYYLDRASGAYVERDLNTAETHELLRRPSVKNPFTVSPDGRYLVMMENDRNAKKNNLLLIPVAGGEVRTLMSVGLPIQMLTGTGWTPDSQAVIAGTVSGGRIELFQISLNSGTKRKLEVDTDGWSTRGQIGFRLSPDGRQITYVTGKIEAEIWSLENFLPNRKNNE